MFLIYFMTSRGFYFIRQFKEFRYAISCHNCFCKFILLNFKMHAFYTHTHAHDMLDLLMARTPPLFSLMSADMTMLKIWWLKSSKNRTSSSWDISRSSVFTYRNSSWAALFCWFLLRDLSPVTNCCTIDVVDIVFLIS